MKADAGSGHQVAKDGKHRDAAVLGLDVSEAIESLLVGVLEEAQWIPEAKRSLCAQSVLEGHLHCGGARNGGGRCECRGTDDGGDDGNESEHFDLWI